MYNDISFASEGLNSFTSSGSRNPYVIVVTFWGGWICGLGVLYGMFLAGRRLRRKRKPSDDATATQNYENELVTVESNVPTYQELDLGKMNNGQESSYQSLQGNTGSLSVNEAVTESDVGNYEELNTVRENEDNNYQSLMRPTDHV